jgi:hypothetical protein
MMSSSMPGESSHEEERHEFATTKLVENEQTLVKERRFQLHDR